MKNSTLIFTLSLFSHVAISQVFTDLTYAGTQDPSFAANYANNTDLISYQAKDGTVLKVGDKLVIGRTSSNNNFATLIFGKYTISRALMGGPPLYLDARYQKDECIIDRIYVNHTKLSKKSSLYVCMFLTAEKSSLGKNRTVIDYEKAVDIGEIINPKSPITRDQAIAKLKEAKDLVELGMMTKEKFDSLKTVYTPIITQQ